MLVEVKFPVKVIICRGGEAGGNTGEKKGPLQRNPANEDPRLALFT